MVALAKDKVRMTEVRKSMPTIIHSLLTPSYLLVDCLCICILQQKSMYLWNRLSPSGRRWRCLRHEITLYGARAIVVDHVKVIQLNQVLVSELNVSWMGDPPAAGGTYLFTVFLFPHFASFASNS